MSFVTPGTTPFPVSIPAQSEPRNPAEQRSAPVNTAWQQWAQQVNTAQIAQDLQRVNNYGGGELLSLLGPRAAAVSPWLAPGYVGLDVYNQAKQVYAANAELERQERIKKTVIKAGDLALVHGIASIGLPLLLTKQVNRLVRHLVNKPSVPPILVRHAKWVSVGAMLALMVALSKPIQILTNFVLNWTYRPLLERKRREEVRKLIQEQRERQLQWLQAQSLWNARRNTSASGVTAQSSRYGR